MVDSDIRMAPTLMGAHMRFWSAETGDVWAVNPWQAAGGEATDPRELLAADELVLRRAQHAGGLFELGEAGFERALLAAIDGGPDVLEPGEGDFDMQTAQISDVTRSRSIDGEWQYESLLVDAEGRTKHVPFDGPQGETAYNAFEQMRKFPAAAGIYRSIVMPMMQKMIQAGEAIESKMLSRQIERAQRKVEAHNFDIRKQLLEYDDVANDQRKVVYHQRTELMAADDIKDSVAAIREEVVAGVVGQHIPPGSIEDQWDPEGLAHALERDFGVHLDIPGWLKADTKLNDEGILKRCIEELQKNYEEKEQAIGSHLLRQVEKEVMLKQLDHHWKEHLAAMDYLRQGIHLRGYAQKNPKQEYKREAFEMFGMLLDQVKHDTISILSRIRIQSEQDLLRMEAQRRAVQEMQFKAAEAAARAQQSAAQPSALRQPVTEGAPPLGQPLPEGAQRAEPETHTPFVRGERKVGRNEPCPCGSGKKFKQCHGRLA